MIYEDEVVDVFEYWKSLDIQQRTNSKLDFTRRKIITDRLDDGYTASDMKLAALGMMKSQSIKAKWFRERDCTQPKHIYKDADTLETWIAHGKQAIDTYASIALKKMANSSSIDAQAPKSIEDYQASVRTSAEYLAFVDAMKQIKTRSYAED